ncbi:PorT family protein [Ornithobacterium rhinotracheale]|uniref:porin family protein n=1 Tax=Ornithobacterium rhinotracheale TaxID=28251 RepID=UPI00129C63D8|nr:porin family protein [Ornithobacterium rhinotracheale]MRI62618.1 PorT family protein [Ornithobacterium rhinotracheale]MRJ07705.1 PorT family protein [Ornithobacterium rhinotracheale]MRJ10337.1 PorT family protein [Ornithobacterium rhinotracheale]UOH78300.1 PorT family protein [Ornithobacterium rhinotracheale]
MKKIILSTLFAVVGLCSVQAQHLDFGVRGAYNYANLRGSSSTGLKLEGRNGYQIGLFAEVPLLGKWSVQPEIYYSTQGAKEVFTQGDEFKTKNINIPLLAKYYIVSGLNLQFGPQISFNTGNDYKFNKARVTDAWKNISNGDMAKGTNFGAVLGLGYRVPLVGLSVDARYTLGLTNVVNDDQTVVDALKAVGAKDNFKNGVFTIGVSYAFL